MKDYSVPWWLPAIMIILAILHFSGIFYKY
jgi:hypothetical protein